MKKDENYLATHFEVVSYILDARVNYRTADKNCTGWRLKCIQSTQGRGGLYQLAKELTDGFELKHQNRDWEDGDFFEELDDYITLYLGGNGDNAFYRHWPDIINLAFPILESKNIKIVQSYYYY